MMDTTFGDELGLYEGDADQYMTFLLGAEEYGIGILKVQEIRGYTPVSAIPNAPPFILGLMNLRGAVIPVVDLRQRFGLHEARLDRFTVIIVVLIGARTVGLVVDAVSDVLTIAAEEVAPTPEMGSAIDTTFITGLVKREGSLVMLLDIDTLVNDQCLALAVQTHKPQSNDKAVAKAATAEGNV